MRYNHYIFKNDMFGFFLPRLLRLLVNVIIILIVFIVSILLFPMFEVAGNDETSEDYGDPAEI